MRSFGPTWALAFTLDRDLLLLLLGVNLAFAIATTAVLFRERSWLELSLLSLGQFTLLNVLSLSGMYLLSGTPVRSVELFTLF